MSDDIIKFDPGVETDSDEEPQFTGNPFAMFGGGEQTIKTTIELPRRVDSEDQLTLIIDSTVSGSETEVDLHVDGTCRDDYEWSCVVKLIGELMGSRQ